MFLFHKDNTLPEDDSIFVFGSNLRGVHGAGAAAEAVRSFGAKWGKGRGLQGKSYAIPTKNQRIESLSLEQIRFEVEDFVQFTHNNPHLRFFVTRVGCGLAGYKDEQIAPMFRSARNCSFAEEWKPFLIIEQ
jgi:hypothetical protein